jgi:hypothetical protein
MGLITIDRNDIIATKDGQTVRVLSVYYNGDALSKIEGIDDSEASPMRRPVFAAQIARVLRKAEPPEPKVEEGQAAANVPVTPKENVSPKKGVKA